MHLCPPIAWKDAYVVMLQRSNVWSAITLWISSDDNLLQKKHTELNREEIYRFPWKSDTFSLDCPESEKLSEICVVSVACSKLTDRRNATNFPFRPIVWFKESLQGLFYFQFLIVKSLGLKNNQISLFFFPSLSLSLLNN